VVFIHGSPGSWDNFLHLLTDPELLRRTRLIALDRPGFGGSSAGGHEPSLARQAEVVEAILAEVIGDRRAVVVAHSYGGAVAVRLAVDAPGRVGALVLVAPSVDPDLEVVRWVQRVAEWPGVSLLVPRALRTANREILPLKKELQDLEARWSEVRVPVTVIHGEKDRLVPVANLDYASRLLAHTDVKAVRTRDEGHFILWTRPDLIRDSILGYVEEMEASASAPHLPSEPKIRLPQSAPPR
jgi:pimeloyl-ACP methyl ester carboxylesterase